MNERDIFTEAMGLSGADERAAFLAGACGDAALRRRVEQLLAFHDAGAVLVDRPLGDALAALGGTADFDSTPGGPTAVTPLAAHLMPSPRPDALGRLGHYDVLEVLGRGGFGTVVKAVDDRLERVVAVKVLAPTLAAAESPRRRFLREARAAARVKHDNVVQIYSVEEEPLPYLVMEYVDGQTLHQRLRDVGRLPPGEVADLGRQVALGLAAAHDVGLIHRDVKPANVLLDRATGGVKLTDFGLARAGDDASLSQSGSIAGTPMYMSPEQASGAALDARSDLFSLGSVLYTLLTGKPPFRADGTVAVLKQVIDDTPPPIRAAAPETPAWLCAVVAKLHAKAPADRYQSAREVADALRLGRGPQLRSRRGGAWAAALAVVALAAGAVAVWRPRGDAVEPTPVAANPPEPKPAADLGVSPAQQQFVALLTKLVNLNPGFDERQLSGQNGRDGIVELIIDNCDNVRDLTPVAALPALRSLVLQGRAPLDLRQLRGLKLTEFVSNGMMVSDLSPLAEMPLVKLQLWRLRTADLSPLAGLKLVRLNVGNSPVKDLSALKGMPLENLCVNVSQVDDLSPLAGMPLRILECERTKVTSLEPLRGMKIQELYLTGSPVADTTPLATLPLKVLKLDYQPSRDRALLRGIPTLEKVNGKPAAEFLAGD